MMSIVMNKMSASGMTDTLAGSSDDRTFDLNRAVLADGGIAIKASNTDTLLQLDAAAGRADQMQFAL